MPNKTGGPVFPSFGDGLTVIRHPRDWFYPNGWEVLRSRLSTWPFDAVMASQLSISCGRGGAITELSFRFSIFEKQTGGVHQAFV